MWFSLPKCLCKAPLCGNPSACPGSPSFSFCEHFTHFVSILESRNAAPGVSKLGVCHPAAEVQQQPQRAIFSRLRSKQELEKMFVHGHLHKSLCWDRLSCPASGAGVTLPGTMTETTWEPQSSGPWRPGRETKGCVVISSFTRMPRFPGVFLSLGVATQTSTRGKALTMRYG